MESTTDLIQEQWQAADLTQEQWQAAERFAKALVKEQKKINEEIKQKNNSITTELNKIIAYLRACRLQQKQPQLLNYLTVLIENGGNFGHGNNNQEYYQCIYNACRQYLQKYLDEKDILKILGWSCRLMRYFQSGGFIEEKIYEEGEIIDATVTKKTETKKKITYNIAGKYTIPEYKCKCFEQIFVDMKVKVKVTRVEDGKIKQVKCVDC